MNRGKAGKIPAVTVSERADDNSPISVDPTSDEEWDGNNCSENDFHGFETAEEEDDHDDTIRSDNTVIEQNLPLAIEGLLEARYGGGSVFERECDLGSRKTVCCKWVYKSKMDGDGNVI